MFLKLSEKYPSIKEYILKMLRVLVLCSGLHLDLPLNFAAGPC